ncbi:MAG TPA: septum formation initiator family protein [Polyangiaceae bacterium]|nr:septum formation initiator family protein [Polyangiaceae bacterium]
MPSPVPARLILERLLPISVLVIAIIAVPTMVFSNQGLRRMDALRGEQRKVDEEVSRLSQEIRRLRAEVSRVRSDLPAIERVARDELGLLRRTEVVFQFGR